MVQEIHKRISISKKFFNPLYSTETLNNFMLYNKWNTAFLLIICCFCLEYNLYDTFI